MMLGKNPLGKCGFQLAERSRLPSHQIVQHLTLHRPEGRLAVRIVSHYGGLQVPRTTTFPTKIQSYVVPMHLPEFSAAIEKVLDSINVPGVEECGTNILPVPSAEIGVLSTVVTARSQSRSSPRYRGVSLRGCIAIVALLQGRLLRIRLRPALNRETLPH